MEYKKGYVYHIKDEYFEKVQDDKLMRNRENSKFRPTYYCKKDDITGLLWVVPMSARVDDKYKVLFDKQVLKYGKSLTIVLGTYDDKKAAFLLQNMFPITSDYLDHIHTKNGNPVPVKQYLQETIDSNMKTIKHLHARGRKIVFPDINRLEKMMIEELKEKNNKAQSEPVKPQLGIKDRVTAAAIEADRRSSERQSANKEAKDIEK